MASFGKAFFLGNLTRDPELRYTPSGSAVCNVDLAVNRIYKTTTGEKREEVYYARCEAWGKQAEVVAEYLKKGSQVFIECRPKLNEWAAKDGSKRRETVYAIENVQFLGKPSGKARDESPTATDTTDNIPGGAGDDEVPF